ncbi:hypothetical protein JHW43_002424 [Diplocarpon mali]|nr:hypothetical protein JHW43_002424 [Diplocarpon mali]
MSGAEVERAAFGSSPSVHAHNPQPTPTPTTHTHTHNPNPSHNPSLRSAPLRRVSICRDSPDPGPAWRKASRRQARLAVPSRDIGRVLSSRRFTSHHMASHHLTPPAREIKHAVQLRRDSPRPRDPSRELELPPVPATPGPGPALGPASGSGSGSAARRIPEPDPEPETRLPPLGLPRSAAAPGRGARRRAHMIGRRYTLGRAYGLGIVRCEHEANSDARGRIGLQWPKVSSGLRARVHPEADTLDEPLIRLNHAPGGSGASTSLGGKDRVRWCSTRGRSRGFEVEQASPKAPCPLVSSPMPVFPGDFLPDDVHVRVCRLHSPDARRIAARGGQGKCSSDESRQHCSGRGADRRPASDLLGLYGGFFAPRDHPRDQAAASPPTAASAGSGLRPEPVSRRERALPPTHPPHMPLPSPPDGGFYAAKISSAPGARLTRRRRDDEASLPAGSGDSLAWLGARMPSANTDPTDSESGASGGRSAAPTPPGLEAYLARRLSARRPLHPS